MSEWSVEYELIDKGLNPNSSVRRSSVFRQLKWVRGEVVTRALGYFGIKRTVPAGEKSHFKKLMRPSYSHTQPLESIPNQAALEIKHILAKNVEDFRRTPVGLSETFHVGRNNGNEYSEFHFGAGESSIIRIVSEIELLPESSLVLIEEIENGLHPIATKRLVEYLVAVAERKRIQVIFTTHSDDALTPLPPEGVWACIDGATQQGKLSIKTLRAISGKIDTALAIFVEDEFAAFLVNTIAREFIPELFEQLEVYSVAGDGNAVKVHRNRSQDPTTEYSSICIIDGDSRQIDNAEENILRLPGQQPEAHIYNEVVANLAENLALLTVSLQLPATRQEAVKAILLELQATNRDPHVIYNQAGIKLGFIPESIVKGAFCNLWVRANQTELDGIVQKIKAAIAAHNQG